ncbi:MAG: hypothetical protein K2L11_09590, partial [Muribaculaceae bacterium]|nr:hypothetical protein [Muribaculaceae bacterium]
FPDCGCKITTFFRLPQVFLKNFLVFLLDNGVSYFYSSKSINVKIYLYKLIDKSIHSGITAESMKALQ